METTTITAAELTEAHTIIDRDGLALKVSDVRHAKRVSFTAAYEEAAMMVSRPQPSRHTVKPTTRLRVLAK